MARTTSRRRVTRLCLRDSCGKASEQHGVRGSTAQDDRRGEVLMKQHKFWAFAAIACMVMCVITGKKRV